MGLGGIFNIATKSLSAYQQALDVTANNIANANDPNYSRQQIILTPEISNQSGNLYFGTGVKISDILRVRDNLTDNQIRQYNQKYSFDNQSNLILNQIQQYFAEPSSSGLSSLMNSFFNSWDKLSVTPGDQSLRDNVVQTGQNLSTQIENIYSGLNSVKSDISSEVTGKIGTINKYIKQIHDLNVKIIQSRAQTAGNPPNDLLDQRDKVIDSLSKLANINVNYDSQNSAIISIGSTFVADKGGYEQLQSKSVNGKLIISTDSGTNVSGLKGGELYALTNLYNNKIPGYQSSIDNFATKLMNSVNARHEAGYTSTNPPQTGIDFFQSYGNGKLTINPLIVKNSNMIAASSDGSSGNGDIALNMASIINQKTNGGTSVLDDYTQLVSRIGSDAKTASDTAQSNQLVLNQLQTQKESYSGVSTDEEMTNIIKYQKSYAASAKVIQITNQMLEDLINMV